MLAFKSIHFNLQLASNVQSDLLSFLTVEHLDLPDCLITRHLNFPNSLPIYDLSDNYGDRFFNSFNPNAWLCHHLIQFCDLVQLRP